MRTKDAIRQRIIDEYRKKKEADERAKLQEYHRAAEARMAEDRKRQGYLF